MGNGNGNNIWQKLSSILLGVLFTIVTMWVACVNDELNKVKARQDQDAARASEVRDQVREHEIAVKRSRDYEARWNEIQKISDLELRRLEIRMLRVEMKLDQVLLGSNIRQPKNLPQLPAEDP